MSTIIGNPIMLGGGSGISAPIIGEDFNWTGGDGTYQVLDDGDGNWRIKLLSSGTFTPLKDMVIDVFCVGGGGGAGAGLADSCGSGGGGGYTTTLKSVVIVAGTSYSVVVGAGGYGYPGTNVYVGTDGGSSSGFGVTANGGKGGSSDNGGDGGSGGGGGIKGHIYTSSTFSVAGGADGSNGHADSGDISTTDLYLGQAGIGQGSTTREFGEETGELYAGGGGGMVWAHSTTHDGSGRNAGGAGGGGTGKVAYSSVQRSPEDGESNTGGGGGGTNNVSSVNSGNGGSGIVIIRKHKEAAA